MILTPASTHKKPDPLKTSTPTNMFAALMAGSRRSGGGVKNEKTLQMENDLLEGNRKMKIILEKLGGKKPEDFEVYIISKGRPKNVKPIHKLFDGTGCLPTWIVGKGETKAYSSAGAKKVFEGGGLCASRNLAIELAKKGGKICVEMSDDISRCSVLHTEEAWVKPKDLTAGNEMARTIGTIIVSPLLAAAYIELQMRAVEGGVHLGGVYPTKNAGQALCVQPLSTDLFVIGDFLIIDPQSAPRFDEKMSLKEDYDFTAQHLSTFGKVARSNRVLIFAKHYTNGGGAVAVRTNTREQYNIAVLRHKWPGVFPQHGTRGVNEVRMTWKMRALELGGKKTVKRPPPPTGYSVLNDVVSNSSIAAKAAGSKDGQPPAKKKKVAGGQRSISSFFK